MPMEMFTAWTTWFGPTSPVVSGGQPLSTTALLNPSKLTEAPGAGAVGIIVGAAERAGGLRPPRVDGNSVGLGLGSSCSGRSLVVVGTVLGRLRRSSLKDPARFNT